MRRTYAYNSIIIGFLLGATVWLSANSPVLGVITGLAVSVVGFVVIRAIENAIDKGVDKAADSISNAYRKHKEKKASVNGDFVQRAPVAPTTQFPTREQTRRIIDDIRPLSAVDEPVGRSSKAAYCPCCGSSVEKSTGFCGVCGSKL